MKFRLANSSDVDAVIQYIKKVDVSKIYTVTIERTKHKRSVQANRLYWLHVTCLADETGSDRDEVHNELKRLYLPSESVTGLYGETVVRPISTSKLDTAQFSAYLEKVVAFASSTLGIVLPMPGDLAFEQFEEYCKNRI